MRKDIGHFYGKSVPEVYHAYIQAIEGLFKRPGITQPYHTIVFVLDFSIKYNMNGGSCTISLMPYQGGTAVNTSYTISQLAGARYDAHYRAMTDRVSQILGCTASALAIDPNLFSNPANRLTDVSSTPIAPPAAPAFVPEAVDLPPVEVVPPILPADDPVTAPAVDHKFCNQCGTRLKAQDRFCRICGKALK